MYQIYGEHIVITVNDWLAAGLSKNIFEHDSKKGDLTIIRRGINGNTLIDVRSIRRADRLAAIERVNGRLSKDKLYTEIAPDQAAKTFFDAYRYGEEGDKSLPDETKDIYCNEAAIFNTIKAMLEGKRAARAAAGRTISMGIFWKNAACYGKDAQGTHANKLPINAQSFERKFKKYLNAGYGALISKKFGNSNTEKLNEEAKQWLIARWATPVDKLTMTQLFNEYNNKAKGVDWEVLMSERTIHLFLNRPEIKAMWYGARYGELKFKQSFAPQHRTMLPTMRDSIWYGDGTKLNYFYKDENGNVATCSVYEVIDAFSECLLGYHLSKSEDFEQQYFAFKMALNISGKKPYQITFDNQGGHKKLMSSTFISKISHLQIATQPYNGNSKTIENVFKRFQESYLHRDWFFTGQNITALKIEGRVNFELFEANKSNLPSILTLTMRHPKRQERHRLVQLVSGRWSRTAF